MYYRHQLEDIGDEDFYVRGVKKPAEKPERVATASDE